MVSMEIIEDDLEKCKIKIRGNQTALNPWYNDRCKEARKNYERGPSKKSLEEDNQTAMI